MIRLQPFDAIVAATTIDHPAVLVSRPRGVAHLYVGPMTPGGAVPRARRPVCKARTGRLYASNSLPLAAMTPRLVCARCSARLAPPDRAERPSPAIVRTRADDAARYDGLSVVDIYLSARFANTEAELDECSLALTLLFTPEQAAAEHVSPTGRTFTNLPKWIDARRYMAGDNTRRQALVDLKQSDGKYWGALTKAEQVERKRTRITQFA